MSFNLSTGTHQIDANSSSNLTDLNIHPYTYACPSSEPISSGHAQMVIFLLVFTLGTIGNLSVLLLASLPNSRKEPLCVYLWSLALIDLLLALSMAMWAINAHAGWIFGNPICKVLSALHDQALYTRLLLLLALCVQAALGGTSSGLQCACAWLLGTYLALPAVLIHGVSRVTEHISACRPREATILHLPISLFRDGVGSFAPMLLFVFASIVYATLMKRKFKSKKEKALVLALTLAFALFQSPHYISSLIKTLLRFGAIERTCHLLQNAERAASIALVLSNCHCVINPVFYALFWPDLLP